MSKKSPETSGKRAVGGSHTRIERANIVGHSGGLEPDGTPDRDSAKASGTDPEIAGVQTLIGADGEPTYAVVPWATWSEIIDRLDAARADRVLARVAAGEATIPGEVIHAIHLDGENPLRAIRKWRAMTQAQLAASVGVGQAYISELETAEKAPSLGVLRALARVLDVDLELLLPPET